MRVCSSVQSDAPSYAFGAGLSSLLWDSLSLRLQPERRQSYHLTAFTKSVPSDTIPPVHCLPPGSVSEDKNDRSMWLTTHLLLLLKLGMSGALSPFHLFAFIAYIGTNLPGLRLSP
jgi:hypothetical protein